MNKETIEYLKEKSLTKEQAIEIVKDLVDSYSPNDIKCSFYNDHAYLKTDRAWGVGCNLDIYFEPDYTTVKLDNGEAYRLKPIVKLGWSSTSRSVATALACIHCYTELTQLAALIESKLSEKKIFIFTPNET
jgi:hypothetical protein